MPHCGACRGLFSLSPPPHPDPWLLHRHSLFGLETFCRKYLSTIPAHAAAGNCSSSNFYILCEGSVTTSVPIARVPWRTPFPGGQSPLLAFAGMAPALWTSSTRSVFEPWTLPCTLPRSQLDKTAGECPEEASSAQRSQPRTQPVLPACSPVAAAPAGCQAEAQDTARGPASVRVRR